MNKIIWGSASTGKTTTLAAYAAKTLTSKEDAHVLFLGFQERLGDEFLGLLRLNDGDASRLANLSFHTFCLDIVREFAEQMDFPTPVALISVSEELSLCLWLAIGKHESPENIRDALAQIRRLKSELVTPEDYIEDEKHAPQHDTVAWLYPAYQFHLAQLGVMDAADLIMGCVRVLKEIPEAATAIAKAYAQIIVDNAETCTDAQWEILNLLTNAGVSLAIAVDQTLAPSLSHIATWPNTEIVRKERIYQLPQATTIAIQSLIGIPASKSAVTPIPYFIGYDDREEADYIAEEVLQQRRAAKASFHDIGIVYRSQAQCHYLMDSLEKHKVPYMVLGKSVANATSVLGDLVGYLRLIENPHHQVALIHVLRQAPYNFHVESLSVLRDHMTRHRLNAKGQFDIWPELPDRQLDMIRVVLSILEDMRAAYAEHNNIKTLLADIISSSGYAAMLENDDTLSSIEDLENLEAYIQNLEEDTPLDGLLADILLTTYDQTERSGDVVSLVNAKNLLGRRFKTVFVCGLEEGIFPHYSAQFDTQILAFVCGLEEGIFPHYSAQFDTQILADEMAHFYRSITRATQYLYLTSAFQRSLYGEVKSDDLSRWVLAFPKNIVDVLLSPKLEKKEIHEQLKARGFACQILTPTDKETDAATTLFSVGNWVSHPVWGNGIIQNCAGELDQLVLTIAFADEERNLMAKYAPLTAAATEGYITETLTLDPDQATSETASVVAEPPKKPLSSRLFREDTEI